jgi:hypothetical protein
MTGNTVTVAIKDATKRQLREFAVETLGLSLANFDHTNVIVAKMRQAGYEKDSIEVRSAADAPGAKPAPAGAKPAQTIEERDAEWFEIEIPTSEAPGGGDPVHVSVNGVGQWIERGKTQWVRFPYIVALQNAIQTNYRQEDEKSPMEPYDVKMYPFMVHRRGLTHDDVRPLIAAYQVDRAGR